MFRWLSQVNYRSLKASIDAQDREIEALKGSFKRLQGAFYARQGREPPPPEPADTTSREARNDILAKHLAARAKAAG